MELVKVVDKLREATERLNTASKSLFKLSRNRAESERIYRSALSSEIVKLRSENVQATLIPDLARGKTADLKFDRDLSMELHRSALSSIHAMQVEIQSWQSILKYIDEV